LEKTTVKGAGQVKQTPKWRKAGLSKTHNSLLIKDLKEFLAKPKIFLDGVVKIL
jgi:hypothetical protein